jgi:hypothetical protein
MIKHVVMFKVKDFGKESEKLHMMGKIKNALDELPAKIPGIVSFETGLNYSESPNAYDIVLISEFKNNTDLKTYSGHPEHLKVVDLIKKNTTARVVVDYAV